MQLSLDAQAFDQMKFMRLIQPWRGFAYSAEPRIIEMWLRYFVGANYGL